MWYVGYRFTAPVQVGTYTKMRYETFPGEIALEHLTDCGMHGPVMSGPQHMAVWEFTF